MAMFVQHNLRAMKSNRMLGFNTASQSKSTEKLSSGYKINRAADAATTATLNDSATNNLGMTGITFEATASKSSQNALASALMNQGVTITSTSAWDTTSSAAKDTTYNLQLNGSAAQNFDKDGNGIPANALDKYFTVNSNGDVVARGDAPKVYDAVGNETALLADEVTATQDLQGSLKLVLHVGADATDNNQITLNIDSMSAKGLGVNGLKVDGSDDKNALSAIETIKEAIQKVSTQHSALGAIQNRLDHTIANLDNVVENTTAAEAQIRDTDMATEMVKYSNNNILTQAGQAMLAQSNQANQGVLSLLQ